MTTKAEFARIKHSLGQDRLRLKTEALALEKRERERVRERAEAVAALRAICGAYGDNDWPDDLPLLEVLQQHLAGPLDRAVGRILQQNVTLRLRLAEAEGKLAGVTTRLPPVRPAPAPAPPPPRPLHPSPSPAPFSTHRPSVIDAELRGERGLRTVCTCGWRSPVERTEAMAVLCGDRHVERFERDRLERVHG